MIGTPKEGDKLKAGDSFGDMTNRKGTPRIRTRTPRKHRENKLVRIREEHCRM